MYSGGESSLPEFELCELSGMKVLRDSFTQKISFRAIVLKNQ